MSRPTKYAQRPERERIYRQTGKLVDASLMVHRAKRDLDKLGRHADALAQALEDAMVWLDTELADADTDERRERLVSDVGRYRAALESYRKARGER